MKLTTTRLITSLVLFAAMVMAIAVFSLGSSASQGVVSAQEEDQDARSESRGKKLEGTWRVHVTLRNCQTGAELRTFPALLTFAQGGTLTGSTTAFPPALRGSDYGIWNHNGGRRYGAVSEAFLFSPAGAWVSTQRITQAIQVGPGQNSFTSDATVEFFDTLGNTTSTGCATAVATRME
jgi:hypothetical protein